MSLTFGFEGVARIVDDAPALLIAYRDDSGADYLDFEPTTPADALVPEDLAVNDDAPASLRDALSNIVDDRHLCWVCEGLQLIGNAINRDQGSWSSRGISVRPNQADGSSFSTKTGALPARA